MTPDEQKDLNRFQFMIENRVTIEYVDKPTEGFIACKARTSTGFTFRKTLREAVDVLIS